MLYKLAALVFGAALLASAGAAEAQGPGSAARLMERHGMGIQVEAAFVAADGCQAMLSGRRYAPPGIVLPHEIIPVTVVIGPDPRGCSGRRVVRHVFGIGGGRLTNIVQLFFVSVDGRLLGTEKVAVTTGW